MSRVPFSEPGRWQRWVQRLAAWGPMSALLARLLPRLDGLVWRWSRGRYTATALLAGLPVIWLGVRGRKTGRWRWTPLVALPVEEGLVVIASSFGRRKHPQWYRNLCVHPQVQVCWREQIWRAVAETVEGARREAYWRLAVRAYPGFAAYARRAAPRRIPVVLLRWEGGRFA